MQGVGEQQLLPPSLHLVTALSSTLGSRHPPARVVGSLLWLVPALHPHRGLPPCTVPGRVLLLQEISIPQSPSSVTNLCSLPIYPEPLGHAPSCSPPALPRWAGLVLHRPSSYPTKMRQAVSPRPGSGGSPKAMGHLPRDGPQQESVLRGCSQEAGTAQRGGHCPLPTVNPLRLGL